MGELLALELPIVTNGDVGDVERIMAESGAGVVVSGFDERAYESALDKLESLAPNIDRWRKAARKWFDLNTGIKRYHEIYKSLAAPRQERDAGA